MSSLRDAIPTEPVLIPGQQLSQNVPWKRDDRPPQPFLRAVPAPSGNTLDTRGNLQADVVSGVHIGACQVIRRLTPGSAQELLALRETEKQGLVPVVMRKLNITDATATEVEAWAHAASALEHPHLARVFPCAASDEGFYWVTALVSGATLAEISDACVKAGKSVPVGIALAAVHEAALALAELHAPPGEAHGLLCDQSLVVGFDGDARVLDVGLFRALRHQYFSPEIRDRVEPYLAPEQVLRGHLPDPRSDVFALAALLHAFLSGGRTATHMSFEKRAEQHLRGGYPPPSTLNVALSSKVDAVVMKALSEEPLDRYANATEFALALKMAASELFWRRELRAQFVGQLFAERKRREEVLFAATSEQSQEEAMARPARPRTLTPPWARPPPLPPLPEQAVKTSKVGRKFYALGEVTPLPIEALPTRQERALGDDAVVVDGVPFATSGFELVVDDGDDYDEAGFQKSKLRPLVLTLIAVMLTWFWQQNVPLEEVPQWAPQYAAANAAALERAIRPHIFPVMFWSPEPLFYEVPPPIAVAQIPSAPLEESAPVEEPAATESEPPAAPSEPEPLWTPLKFIDLDVAPPLLPVVESRPKEPQQDAPAKAKKKRAEPQSAKARRGHR